MASVPQQPESNVDHSLAVRHRALRAAKAAGCESCQVIDAALAAYRKTGNRFDAVRAARAAAEALTTPATA